MDEEFDFSLPLQFAISQLQGNFPVEEEMEEDIEESQVHFPKPASLSAAAEDEDDPRAPPPSIMSIIDALGDNFDNYPKLVQIMMHRGLLRKKQQCRKCSRMMHLRRRKNSYEWRCRTRDKRGDCSSCSIKYGSWFELTKLAFNVVCRFLIMHCKNCSPAHIVNQLKISTHTLNEVRKVVFELSHRIHLKYPRIGGRNKNVYLEFITVGPKPTNAATPFYKVLAGQEVGSKKCFVRVLSDEKTSTIERVRYEHISAGTNVTVVVTVNGETLSYASQNAEFLDESTLTNGSSPSDMFFTKLRDPIPEAYTANAQILQKYLNDQVVRRTEGLKFLEECFKEIMTYT